MPYCLCISEEYWTCIRFLSVLIWLNDPDQPHMELWNAYGTPSPQLRSMKISPWVFSPLLWSTLEECWPVEYSQPVPFLAVDALIQTSVCRHTSWLYLRLFYLGPVSYPWSYIMIWTLTCPPPQGLPLGSWGWWAGPCWPLWRPPATAVSVSIRKQIYSYYFLMASGFTYVFPPPAPSLSLFLFLTIK